MLFQLTAAALLSAAAPASAGAFSMETSLTQSAALPAGQRTTGRLVVRNNTDEEMNVAVYLRDYAFAADGSNQYAAPGELPRSNGHWVSFAPESLVLPPKGRGDVMYAVDVPPEEALDGAYWSMLMVSSVPDNLPATAEEGEAVSVRTVFRYGVQIITEVGSEGTAGVELQAPQLEADSEGGPVRLTFDAVNTGTAWLDPPVWVELFDTEDGTVERYDAPMKRLLPGCSVRHAFDFGALDTGNYEALVVVDGGDDRVFGTRYIIDIP